MSTNFLYAQAPNRKGNISKNPAKHEAAKGGTAGVVTHGTQGAAKASDAFGNNNVAARKQPVLLSTPKGYCGKIENDGYLKGNFNPSK